MKVIPLTKGYSCQVSDEDYEYLSRWKWRACITKLRCYAKRSIRVNGKITSQFMHKVIAERMGISVEHQIDHIDGDSLNNQRDNLRAVTNQQNSRNRRVVSNRTGFKGVYLKPNGRYRARIRIGDKFKVVGSFKTAEEAARAYDRAAREYFGEHACTNF